MKIELNSVEARIIGCLIEKQITTPDQYPLSLNALVNACNQKSNREPLMALDESTVQLSVDTLSRKHLLLDKSGFGSRVTKYRHCFCNTEFGTLKFDAQELAIVCELLLRGPQTPGELRSRSSRMASFTDVSEVEVILDQLSKREGGPYVRRIAREPGRRDSRYAHLFGDQIAEHAHATDAQLAEPSRTSDHDVSHPASEHEQRLARLEQEVHDLRAELRDLKTLLGS